MKKVCGILLLGLFFAMTSICLVHAADNIVEVPETRIILDGKAVSYQDVPISINNRTMLPLRALLLDLGVKEKDIEWDGEDKTVTFKKGITRIRLEIGSNIARVNGRKVEMDVAPFGHSNQRVYIPLRFVSQNLGKEVVWDGATKTIYITDKKDFDKTKQILEQSAKAMEKVKTAGIAVNAEIDLVKQSQEMSLEMNMVTEIDRKEESLHTIIDVPLFDQNIRMETYYLDKTKYEMSPLINEWVKEEMAEDEYKKILAVNFDPVAANINEMLYAGLKAEENEDTGKLILKGNIYLSELFDSLNDRTQINKPVLKDYYTEIAIDRKTMRIDSIHMTFTGALQTDGSETLLNAKVSCKYEWYDQELDIELPD